MIKYISTITLILLGIGLFGLIALGESNSNPPLSTDIHYIATSTTPVMEVQSMIWDIHMTGHVDTSDLVRCLAKFDCQTCKQFFNITCN